MNRIGLRISALAAGLLMAATAHASFHLMQIEQVIGGVNGDMTAQAIQLRMRSADQNLVHLGRLIVRDAAGLNPVTLIDINADVPVPTGRVLIATPNMANYLAVAPNFTMLTPIPAAYLAAGTLTWEQDSPVIVYWRTSWGGASYTGVGTMSTLNDATANSNPAFGSALPSGSLQALQFKFTAGALSVSGANDYQITAGAATFVNNAGLSAPVVASLPSASVFYGVDLLQSPRGGASREDFGANPLPAGFFGVGSDQFTGVVSLQGSPLDPSGTGPLGPTDTIVRRDMTAAIAPGGSAGVPIEILALHLVSSQPITVTYNGGASPEQWQVDAWPSNTATQTRGTMQISQNGCTPAEGGTFSSTVSLQPRFVFTRTNPTPAMVEIDYPSGGLPAIPFTAAGKYLPADPGFGLSTLATPTLVEHDGDVATLPISTGVRTSNFFPGTSMARCDSAGCVSPPTPILRMTAEAGVEATLGLLLTHPCANDADGDGICDDADNCPTTPNPLQTDADHDGIGDGCDNCLTIKNFCQEDVNHDGIGDLCQPLSVGDAVTEKVMLRRLSPNPVSSALSYSLAIPRDMHVSVSVFDVRGRLIDVVLDRTLSAGEHSFTWDAGRAGLETGSYFLRLETPDAKQARKFSVVR